jgi:hypothetical protein
MIYELFLWKNNPLANAAYDNIRPEDQKALDPIFSDEGMDRYGAKFILYCDCTWANQEYLHWGIVRYNSIEDKIKHDQAYTKAGWFHYAELFTLLGTPVSAEETPKLPDLPNPIYQLWMIRNHPVTTANYAHLTKEEETQLWAVHNESEKRTGAQMVLYCKSAWANEEYLGFGVTAYPNIEACQVNRDDLEKINWPLYFMSFSILGTTSAG